MLDIFTADGLREILYFLPALLIALSFHEFAHAYTAYKFGDKSQKALGRLTISPFAHIDIFGFIFMLLFKFGWGKPVIINDASFKNRKRDSMLVALAGPLANVCLAIVFTVILKILFVFGFYNLALTSRIAQIILTMLINVISFNMVFAVFNLIPLPPFDGSKVLYYFLPNAAKRFMDKLERYSIWILLILVVTDLYVYIIMPMYALLNLVITWIMNL